MVTPGNVKDRIAALQQRTTSPQPTGQDKSTSPPPSGGSLRAKIAKFEEKGGVPVPRGSFGFNVVPNHPEDEWSRRKGQLYGNRIPSISKMTPSSSTASTLSVDSDTSLSSPTRKRCISTSALQGNRLSRSFSTNSALDEEGAQEELESSLLDSPTKPQRRASISNAGTLRSTDFNTVPIEAPTPAFPSNALADSPDKSGPSGIGDDCSPDPLTLPISDPQVEVEHHVVPHTIDIIKEEDEKPEQDANDIESNAIAEPLEQPDSSARNSVQTVQFCENEGGETESEVAVAEVEDQETQETVSSPSTNDKPVSEAEPETHGEAISGRSSPMAEAKVVDSLNEPSQSFAGARSLDPDLSEVQEIDILPKDETGIDDTDLPTPGLFSPSPFTATVEAAERAYHETQHYVHISPSNSSLVSPVSAETSTSPKISLPPRSPDSEAKELIVDSNSSPPPIIVEDVECEEDKTIRLPGVNTSASSTHMTPGTSSSSSSQSSPQSSTRSRIPLPSRLPTRIPSINNHPPSSQISTIPLPSRRSHSPNPIFVPPPVQEQHYVEPSIEIKTGPKSFHAVVHSKKVLAKSPVDSPDTTLLKGETASQVLNVKGKTGANGEPTTPGSPDLSLLLAQAAQLEQRLMGGDDDGGASRAETTGGEDSKSLKPAQLQPMHETIRASLSNEDVPPTPPPKSPQWLDSNGRPIASYTHQTTAIGRHVRDEHSSRGSWSSENHSSEDSQAILTPPSPTFDLVTPPLADEHAFHEFGVTSESLGRRSSSASSGSIWTSPRKAKKSLSRSNTFMGRMLSRAGLSSTTLALPGNYSASLSADGGQSDSFTGSARPAPPADDQTADFTPMLAFDS